ncbi:hypothetical protein J3A83DRAFT_4369019 [Scleroderma citrinum]
MSTFPQYVEKIEAKVFHRPTFGYAARIGELFDVHKNQFLGVQLYDEEVMKKNIQTFPSNGMGDTLDMLADVVETKGSSSYLKDTSTCGKARPWALALWMQTEEDHLLFEEDSLGYNILDIVKEIHLTNGLATHFVSSVVCGGNVVTTMTEKYDPTRTQPFNLMNLMYRTRAEGKFDCLDNKFDLAVDSDIDLEEDPMNVKDLFKIIPHAIDVMCGDLPNYVEGNSQIGKTDGTAGVRTKGRSRGVPISVTLQPIFPELRRTDLGIFQLKNWVARYILYMFSKLEDVHVCFTTLIDKMMSYREFIPSLVERVMALYNRFRDRHLHLLVILHQFIRDIRSGDEARMKADFDHGTPMPAMCTNPFILSQAKILYATYTIAGGTLELFPHKSPLVFLEKSFRAFLDFLNNLQCMLSRLTDKYGNELPSRLSTVDDIRRALRHQLPIPLFILTPSIDDSCGINTAVDFLVMLRNHKTYHQRYLLYLEDCSDEGALPHKGFLNLREPGYFLGKLNANGN